MKRFRLGAIIDNDKILRIVSFLFSIILWLVVSIVVNPSITTSITNIPLNIEVKGSATGALGLDVVKGQDQRVSALISGKRYAIGRLTPDDFMAMVNLSGVTEPGEYDLEVRILKKSDTPDYSVVNAVPSTVKLSFDRIISKELKLEVETPNLKVKDGYIMEKSYSSFNMVKIVGPEQSIDKISKIVLKSNSSETLSKTYTTNGEIEFYDKEGTLLKLTGVDVLMDSFEITVPVYKKQTVNIKFDYINVPTNFPVDSLKYTMSASQIDIAYPTDAKNVISDIYVGNVDFMKLGIGGSYTFDIVLPTGYINLSNVKTVTIDFDKGDYTSKTLNVTNFTFLNEPADYNVKVITKSLNNVKINAPENIIDKISSSDVIGSIDFNGVQIKSGEFSVNVKMIVVGKEDSWVEGEYTVVVSATPK